MEGDQTEGEKMEGDRTEGKQMGGEQMEGRRTGSGQKKDVQMEGVCWCTQAHSIGN